MQTECSADLFGFARVEGRAVVAGFDGGKMTSDAGALLLGATDRAIRLVDRFAGCFTDSRAPELIEHEVGRWSGSGCLAGAGLRRSGRSRRAAPRPDDGGAGRQAVGAAQGLCAAGRQIDAQPARAGRAGADALSPDRHGIGAEIEALFVDLFVEAHHTRRSRSSSISVELNVLRRR